MKHESVLLQECLDGLAIKPDGIYVDGTLGAAGHSSEILKRLTAGGHLYSFDQDTTVIEHAHQRLSAIGDNYTIIQSNFVHLKSELAKLGVTQIDGILFDLGVSSMQFDTPERGFSYNYDARLDMRMDPTAPVSAWEVVNEWEFNDLMRIFTRYGEEKFSKQIARKIEQRRAITPINTTFELVEIIKEAIPAPARRKGGHPAKRIFQAIRIAVNDELRVFEDALKDAISITKIGGRIAVITFHSLEDRICKHVFKDESTVEQPSILLPMMPQDLPKAKLKLVTRKPIVASEEELEANNRAHSAKLRVAEVQI